MADPTRTAAPNATASVADADVTASAGASAGLPLSPAPGTRYVLGDEIARGGMGAVYRATDSVLGREVAVKVLLDKYGPATGAARRFADEARITGQLQHPAIPPVHDLGTLPDGRPFLAMKLIKGHTLDDRLKARIDPSQDRGRFVAVFEAICQAVAYAHAHNVIHRDLKPANVMVGAFGEVQVMDWGLAKVLTATRAATASGDSDETAAGTEVRSLRDSDSPFTQAGSVLGTPAFMPPEQAAGAVGSIDARSDVFGLGAILAVILTGRPPFVSTSAETTRVKAAQGDVAECFARLDASGADPDLVVLCKRCLNPRSEHRPADADEVARAVAGLRQAADERARQAELDRAKAEGEKVAAESQAKEQRKRRRVQMALGLSFTALVVLGGAFGWWADRQAAERAAERDRFEADGARAAAAIEADRVARRAATDGSVTAALREARGRAEEAWGLADDPERMRAAADLAAGVLRRADGFASAGEVTPPVGDDLAAVRAELADLDRHARLFLSAARILQEHAQLSSGVIDGARTTRRLADVFAEYGWPQGEVAPDVVAEAVCGSRFRNQFLGYLSDWAFQSGSVGIPTLWLESVLRLARHRAGGSLAAWQTLRDRSDTAGIIAFAATPPALELGPEQICQLNRDLLTTGQTGSVLPLLRRAVERYPRHVWLRYDLMRACDLASPPLGEESLQQAAALAALRPESAWFQNLLGDHLLDRGAPDPAEGAFREALRLDPDHAAARANLARARRLRLLLVRLPDILAGRAEPASPAEACEFAGVCAAPFQKRFVAAARLYTMAFEAEPNLADRVNSNRYNAACFAARAARGDGNDAPEQPANRAELRATARSWLRADLALVVKLAASKNSSERYRAIRTLSLWLTDRDLLDVRGVSELGKLSVGERVEWNKFWADVAATLAQAQRPPKSAELAPAPRPAE